MPRHRSFLPLEIAALRHAADNGGGLTLTRRDLAQPEYRYLRNVGLIRPNEIEFHNPCPSWRLGQDDQAIALATHILSDEGWRESGRSGRRTDGLMRVVFRDANSRSPWREIILRPRLLGTSIQVNGRRLLGHRYTSVSPPRVISSSIDDAIDALIRECLVVQVEFQSAGTVPAASTLYWGGTRLDLAAGTQIVVAIRSMINAFDRDPARFSADLLRLAEMPSRHRTAAAKILDREVAPSTSSPGI